MYFRPYPVLTILTLPGLALLLWLGQWQWSRMDEKAGQIAAYEALAAAGPASLADVFCGDPEDIPGRPIVPAPGADGGVRFWGQNGDGQSGWRQFVAVELPDCAGGGHILQEADFTPFGGDTALAAGPDFRVSPVPAHRFLDAPNDPAANEFYRFDAERMAGWAGVDTVREDYWIVADRGLPADLAAVPPSRHLGYALTWFGMAIVLVAVFAAFHAANGRLGFTRR